MSFLARQSIPPPHAVHFPATEPFTVLGISPRATYADVDRLSSSRSSLWLEHLCEEATFNRERQAISDAKSILGDRHSCTQYRSFARSYDKSRRPLSRGKLQRQFAHAVVSHAPALRKRQNLHDIRSGGIFGVSLLISIVLLIVVLTIPIGGLSIFGFTLFAQTLIAAWGPFAIIPAAALIALGGLGAYWYRQHKHIFKELQSYLAQVMDHMEAMAYSVEDRFLLLGFRLFQKDSTSFHVNKAQVQKARDAIMSEFVAQYTAAFVERLSMVVQETQQAAQMRVEDFFAFLAEHPAEVQNCFHSTFSELVINQPTASAQLEAAICKGGK